MTSEDRVYKTLRLYIKSRSDIILHSGHPPSGKAYDLPLIPFKAGKLKRYHFDLIWQVGHTLIFQELKGAYGELQNDINKLREFKSLYPLEKIKTQMKRRVTKQDALLDVTAIALCVGCENAPTASIEPDFIVISVVDDLPVVSFGSDIEIAVREAILYALFGSPC